MSDERSLPATERRRTEARRNGWGPRSSDLTTAAALLAVIASIKWLGGGLESETMRNLLGASDIGTASAIVIRADEWSPSAVLQRAIWSGLKIAGGMGLAVGLTVLLVEWLQAGFKLRGSSLLGRRGADSPPGFGVWRLGTSPSLTGIELVRRLSIPGLAGLWLLSRWEVFRGLITASPGQFIVDLQALLIDIGLCVVVLLLAFGAMQYGWSWICHEQALRMTPDELREEQRESGNRRQRRPRAQPSRQHQLQQS